MKKEEMSLKRKLQICESAKKLMAQKSLDKITIQEIADDCGINRYTFYYHFKDIYDLLGYIFEEEALAHIRENGNCLTWEDGIELVLQTIRDNQTIYKCVLNSARPDILHQMFYQEVNPLISMYLSDIIERKYYHISPEYQAFLSDFYTMAMEGMLVKWVREGLRQSNDVAIRYLRTIMGGQLEDVFRQAEQEGFCIKEGKTLCHKIICISRQFGSGGREIGMEAARALGIQCYDKQLITLASVRGELNHEKLTLFDEKRENPWFYEAVCEGPYQGKSFPAALFQLQSDVIRSIARNEDAVIIGRCADQVLKGMEGIRLLTVYITAPFEHRVRRKMELEQVDWDEAKALVKKTDRQRDLYYRSHTGKNWGDPSHYDLYFDSSQQSKEEIVGKIVEAYQQG